MSSLITVQDDPEAIAAAAGVAAIFTVIARDFSQHDSALRVLAWLSNELGTEELKNIGAEFTGNQNVLSKARKDFIHNQLSQCFENIADLPNAQKIKSNWNLPLTINF